MVGLNGVGKTTLVNIINNIVEADDGEVKINAKVATCFSETFLPQCISIYELIKYRNLDLNKLDTFFKMFDIELIYLYLSILDYDIVTAKALIVAVYKDNWCLSCKCSTGWKISIGLVASDRLKQRWA